MTTDKAVDLMAALIKREAKYRSRDRRGLIAFIYGVLAMGVEMTGEDGTKLLGAIAGKCGKGDEAVYAMIAEITK